MEFTISIAIPVYNGAATLESCLASVESAVLALPTDERERIEVVICDNQSTDGSAAIIAAQAFSCPNHVVRPAAHLENRTENWRFALSATTAPWMVMLHADDGLVPTGLRAWLDAVACPAARGVGFVSARHHTFSDDMQALDPLRPHFPLPALVSGTHAARWSLPLLCPFVPFTLMRRDAYVAVGSLDVQFELTQDWDLWWKLCKRGDFLYWPAAVGAWRVHGAGAKYQRRNMADHLTLLEQMRSASEGRPPALIDALAERTMAARVRLVLARDETVEADDIRRRVRAIPDRSLNFWLRAGQTIASATLNTLRAAGTVRFWMRQRAAARR